jgi:Fe-S-cluster containining protein
MSSEQEPFNLIDAYAIWRDIATDDSNPVSSLETAQKLISTLASGTYGSYPDGFCQKGCSACCYYPTGLFTIQYSEWAIIASTLDKWDEKRRAELFARNARGWILHLYQLAQAHPWYTLLMAPVFELLKLKCPFLDKDMCSIYEVRPHVCRAFGAFQVRGGGFSLFKRKVFACETQGTFLLEASNQPGAIALPVFNVVLKFIAPFLKGPSQSLPLWLSVYQKKVPLYKRDIKE